MVSKKIPENSIGASEQEMAEPGQFKEAWASAFHHIGHFVMISRFDDTGVYSGEDQLTKGKEWLCRVQKLSSGQPRLDSVLRLSGLLVDVRIGEKRDEDVLNAIVVEMNKINATQTL